MYEPILARRGVEAEWKPARLLGFGIDCEENRADNVMHFTAAIVMAGDGTCSLEPLSNIKFVDFTYNASGGIPNV